MTRQEIFEKLNEVFSDVFDEEITVTAETTADDIDEWDSAVTVISSSNTSEKTSLSFSKISCLVIKMIPP